MDNIQRDISEEAQVTAIRANLCDFFHHLGRSVPEGHFVDPKFSRWHSSLAHPWFNGVLSSDPPGEKDDAFVEETIEYFRANNVGMFTWWMSPHLRPASWEAMLFKHGFGFSNATPGMAVALEALDDSMQTVNGLEVRVVEEEESLRVWAQVFVLGYGLPADWEPAIHKLWLRLGLGVPFRNYLGYWNGTPVATSCIFFGGGAAGIYSVSTVLEARGQGIGAAMTLTPLLMAREMGYRIGILQSSEMGFNVYRKLGFRHVCQIENFYLDLR